MLLQFCCQNAKACSETVKEKIGADFRLGIPFYSHLFGAKS